MAKIVKGPFNVEWGGNTLTDVSEIALEYEQATNDYATVDGRSYTIDGAITASVSLTLLASDVSALAVVLPQYFVPMGGTMSSGEEVLADEGAIDIRAASCDAESIFNDLDVISCGQPGDVFRLKNARTRIDSMEFADNVIRTITVMFVGEPEQGVGNIQFFTQGGISEPTS